jgi:hypothetical protein
VLISSMISIWVAAERLFKDWIQAQIEKEGIKQG